MIQDKPSRTAFRVAMRRAGHQVWDNPRVFEDPVARGVKQYVVLGAGLDTFAYRNPFPDIRVFEVDFLATQAWKRSFWILLGLRFPRR